MRNLLFVSCFLTCILSVAYAQPMESEILAHWNFDKMAVVADDMDEEEEGEARSWSVQELLSGNVFEITGLAKLVPGVTGNAIKFVWVFILCGR